eukprot:2004928-Rhodomonas_salina.2
MSMWCDQVYKGSGNLDPDLASAASAQDEKAGADSKQPATATPRSRQTRRKRRSTSRASMLRTVKA